MKLIKYGRREQFVIRPSLPWVVMMMIKSTRHSSVLFLESSQLNIRFLKIWTVVVVALDLPMGELQQVGFHRNFWANEEWKSSRELRRRSQKET
ncbi:MAG: hypothetical protein K2X47_13750 [Bdellovibrionales bacterium]|nr:hypothetical protein [Bdellovibrionales bacterium]